MLGWRTFRSDPGHVGNTANDSRPHVAQLFVGAGGVTRSDQDAFERKLYVIRRVCRNRRRRRALHRLLLFPHDRLQGMLTSQVPGFYPELRTAGPLGHGPRSLALSTNTFPSWDSPIPSA